jgi:hypothetical protein
MIALLAPREAVLGPSIGPETVDPDALRGGQERQKGYNIGTNSPTAPKGSSDGFFAASLPPEIRRDRLHP